MEMQPVEIDWSLFDAEWAQFVELAYDQDSSKRDGWGPWLDPRTAEKIAMNLRVLLTRLAAGSNEKPTLLWLCDLRTFEPIFKDHKQHLVSCRNNKKSAATQTLRSFKQPVTWAAKELSILSESERKTLLAMHSNYMHCINKNSSKDKRARAEIRKASEAQQAGPQWLEFKGKLADGVASIMAEIEEHGVDGASTNLQLQATLHLALVLQARGNRGAEFFKLHFAESKDAAEYLVAEELLPEGGSVLYDASDGGRHRFYILSPDIKGHLNHVELPPADSDLTSRCVQFLGLQTGDYVFTPGMKGLRRTKQKAISFDSTTWSNFILSTSQQLLGVGLRPRGIRRLRATHVVSTPGASGAVVRSVAAAMGTSPRHLRGVYNSNSMLSETQLSLQLEEFGDDCRFAGAEQTVVLPFEPPEGAGPALLHTLEFARC